MSRHILAFVIALTALLVAGGAGNGATPAQPAIDGLADVAITMTDEPDPVSVGANLTYHITVTNGDDADTATGVTVKDVLPTGVTFVSATTSRGDTCTAGETVTCQVGTLAPLESVAVTIVVTPTQEGSLTNQATVSSTTPELPENLTNNTATETTTVTPPPPPPPSADVALTKSDAPDPVTAGEEITYTLDVVNNGPDAAADVTVTDDLPANVTHVSSSTTQGSCSGTTTVVCTLGTLGPSASAQVTIVVSAGGPGEVVNEASVASTTDDPNAANNTASTSTVVIAPPTAPPADLRLAMSDAPDPVTVGEELTYTLIVVNDGPNTAVDVRVSDTLPQNVTFVSATSTKGTCAGATTVQCVLGDVAPSEMVEITIVVRPTQAGQLTNSAVVFSTSFDPDRNDNSATATTTVNSAVGPPGPDPSADLATTKTDSADPVTVGGELVYTVTVANNGPSSAADVRVTDTLPDSVDLVEVVASQGSCAPGRPVTCSLGSLAVSATAVVRLTVRPREPGSIVNVATASSSVTDPVSSNNAGSAETTVVAPTPNPAPAPAPAPDTVAPGEVRAVGARPANRAVQLSWQLPGDADLAGVTITRSRASGGAETRLFVGRASTYTDRGLRNGVRYRYRLTTFDASGNRSPGVVVTAVPRAPTLISPAANAALTSPPTLRWRAVKGATYYNVQVFRGATKILSAWPRGTSLRLRSAWRYAGRTYRLQRGSYRWYVWPGYGSRRKARYGPLLGQSTFSITRR